MSVLDIITIGVIVLIFSISLIIGSYVWGEITDTPVFKENVHANATINQVSNIMFSFNGLYPYILIGLFLMVLISAYYIETHPIFFVISIGFLAIGIFTSGILVETFNSFASKPTFGAVTNQYPLIVQTWQNMPVIMLVMGSILMVVMYAKYRRDNMGGPIQ